MAKLEEGDQRWIVEERKDGANVHGVALGGEGLQRMDESFSVWFVLLWRRCKRRQRGETKTGFRFWTKMINGVRLLKPLRIATEAYLNQRKGKIIAGYELEISVDYELEGERK